MQLPIKLTTIDEYELAASYGWHPLQDYKKFALAVPLRVDLQRELFGRSFIGKGNVVQANQRFYVWCWEHSPQICEECTTPLHGYSSKFISHIIGRGARADIAHDPRNKNILCFKHHQQWENEQQRKSMRIYKTNLKIIELLKLDYQ